MFNSLFKGRTFRSLAVRLGFSYIRWVGETSRWQISGLEHYLLERSKGGPVIFAFWHNQLMMMPFCYQALARRQKLSALASQSRDGQVVSDFLERFGFKAVRGSSSRGGGAALLALKRKIEEGFDIAMTPDGPRGPAFEVEAGVIALALSARCPILPVAIDFRHKKTLSSWDRFRIPRPYNQAALVAGPAIQVNGSEGSDGLAEKLKELQTAMNEVNRKAKTAVSCKW